MSRITEKVIEKHLFDNLDLLIPEIEQKARQRSPVHPFITNLEAPYGGVVDAAKLYREQKKVDIAASCGDVLHIVEVKKYRESWVELSNGITQLLEYARLAACTSSKYQKIELHLVCDKIPDNVKEMISYYQMPINLVLAKCDAIKGFMYERQV